MKKPPNAFPNCARMASASAHSTSGSSVMFIFTGTPLCINASTLPENFPSVAFASCFQILFIFVSSAGVGIEPTTPIICTPKEAEQGTPYRYGVSETPSVTSTGASQQGLGLSLRCDCMISSARWTCRGESVAKSRAGDIRRPNVSKNEEITGISSCENV